MYVGFTIFTYNTCMLKVEAWAPQNRGPALYSRVHFADFVFRLLSRNMLRVTVWMRRIATQTQTNQRTKISNLDPTRLRGYPSFSKSQGWQPPKSSRQRARRTQTEIVASIDPTGAGVH